MVADSISVLGLFFLYGSAVGQTQIQIFPPFFFFFKLSDLGKSPNLPKFQLPYL